MSTTLSTFDIREHIDRLTPSKKGKNYYECPMCQGSSLSIDPKSGKYKCWSGDCESASIREAIRPWSEVRGETIPSYRPAPKKASRQQPKSKAAPIPASLRLLQLAEPAWDCPAPKPIDDELWKIVRGDKKISGRSRSALTQTAYCYGDGKMVYRIEWPDETNPKGHDKTYRQCLIDADGKRAWTKGDGFWPAYRIDEVVETLEDVGVNEAVAVLGLEGEPNIELARSHGIVTLTFQGSNWTEAEVVAIVEALRATGKNVTLIVLRDNDTTGIKKAELIKSVCDRLQFPCIIVDPVAIYPDIPDKGDIKEILDAMDADEFIRRLEAQIHASADADADWDDSIDFKAPAPQAVTSTNLSMLEVAANEARKILRSNLDELTTNLKLEEVRQMVGLSENFWENKIIKPLKRGMDAERFKLDLLALLQVSDPVEQSRQIALLAPKYSMGAGTLKEAMAAMRQRTQAPEVEVLTLEELYDSESEAIEWLVPGLLPVGETVLLCALPKVGKSKAAVDLAFCVATGESRFLGQKTKQGKVLLITPDASPQSLKQELRKRGFRKQDSQNLHIFPRWSIDQMAVLESELETFRPDLVVIDSLKKITAGKEISENSAEFADNIIALNDMLTRYRAAGILVHHANKGNDAIGVERARGSTAIVGACWGTWMLDRIPKPDPNNKKKLIHDPKCPKRIFTATNRDSEGTTLNIEFNAENNSWDFISEVGIDEEEAAQQQTHRERILSILQANSQRPLSGPEIMELLGISREQRGPIYSELGRMENKRLISSKPAPGDKRFNLYFLPNFEETDTTGTVTVSLKISLPPPPPTPTVSIADYSSEIYTVYGLENSQQNSQQIVSNNPECDSYKIAETPSDKSINPIVSNLPLSQGGEGVKCTSDSETVTEEKVKLSHSIPIVPSEPPTPPTPPTPPPPAPPAPTAPPESIAPLEPEPDAELVKRGVEALRKAIAENDAVAVREAATMSIKLDSTGRLKSAIKALLTPEENKACRELANAKLKQPEVAEPIALPATPAEPAEPVTTPAQPTDTSSEAQPELPEVEEEDAMKMWDIALVWWPEMYPEGLQSLVAQMWGWGAPARKYSAAQIAQWLEEEDEVVKYRIGELMAIGLADNYKEDEENE